MSQTAPTARPASTPADRRAERAARNARIAEAREAGEPWKSIAQREGISVKQAQRGRKEHLDSLASQPEALPPLDVGALVERAVRVQLLALDHLERLARTGPNDSAQVGAAKGLSSVGVTLVALLARLGFVGSPVDERFTHELRVLARAFFEFAEEHGVPGEAVVTSLLGQRLIGYGLVDAREHEGVGA